MRAFIQFPVGGTFSFTCARAHGRPPAMTEEQIRHARALLAQPDSTITSIAKLLRVSRTTIYKYVPRTGGGPGLTGPEQVPACAPQSSLSRVCDDVDHSVVGGDHPSGVIGGSLASGTDLLRVSVLMIPWEKPLQRSYQRLSQ
jgi:hypothetical protein